MRSFAIRLGWGEITMTNSEYLRQSDENLARFIDQINFYCSTRFVDNKSCSEVGCPLAREGWPKCDSRSIMEWLEKEE